MASNYLSAEDIQAKVLSHLRAKVFLSRETRASDCFQSNSVFVILGQKHILLSVVIASYFPYRARVFIGANH